MGSGLRWRGFLPKLMVRFLVLALVPLGVLGYLSYNSARQSLLRGTEAHLQSVAILKDQEIAEWTHHLGNMIEWLRGSPQVVSGATTLVAGTGSVAEQRTTRESIRVAFGRFELLGHLAPIFLIDAATGVVLVSSDPSLEGTQRGGADYFIVSREGAHVSSVFHSQYVGGPTLVVAGPVTTANGQLLAVIAGHSSLASLDEIMLERSGLGETGETYLVNKSNLLVTSLRHEPDSTFREWIYTAGVDRALRYESGVATYEDYRGEPVIGAYRWVEELDVALLAEIDRSEALASVTRLRNTVVGIGVGVALAIVLVGLLFSRAVTQPLWQLTVAAGEIGGGNPSHRTGVSSKDEIGRLAQTLDEMAAALQATTASRDELNQEMAAHRQSLEKLQRMDEQLAAAQRIAQLGSWEWDIVRNETLWSDELYRIFGVSPERFDADAYEGFMRCIHPDDRQLVAQTMETAVSDQKPFEIGYRIVRPDGTVRDVEASGEIVCDETGDPVSMIGASQDVTERKRAEANRL